MILPGFRLLLALLPLLPVAAQNLPQHQSPRTLFEDGRWLFAQSQYEAAQGKFEQYLQSGPETGPLDPTTEAQRTDAQLYRARCAYELLKYNAESLLQQVMDQHPGHAHRHVAGYYLGKLHFIKRRFADAQPVLQATNPLALEATQRDDRQFMLGYCAFMQNDPAAAQEYLAPLADAEGPLQARASYYLGIVQYNQKQYAAALGSFRKVESEPDYRLLVPVYITSSLLETKQYAELERYGSRLLEQNEAWDQKPYLYQQIGAALYALKKYAQAERYFEAGVVPGSPASRELNFLLGLSRYQQQKWTLATAPLEAVVEVDDSLGQASAYYLGFVYIRAQRPDDARFAFRRAGSLGFNAGFQRDALLQFGKLSFDQEYYTDALDALQEYAQRYPTDANTPEARALAGEALFQTQQYGAALRFLQQSGLKTPRAKQAYQQANLHYGIQLFEAGKRDSAELFLQPAAESHASETVHQTANLWYGELLFNKREYLLAAKAYTNMLNSPASAKHPQYAHALLGLGWCHFRLEHFETAKTHFIKALALPGLASQQPALYEDACLRTGDCFFKEKDYAQALRYYEKAQLANARQPDYALFQLATTRVRQRQYLEAVPDYKKLVALHAQSDLRDDALLALSDVYFTWLNDNSQAVAYAKQLVAQHPQSPLVPNAYLNLGLAAQNAGNKTEAIQNFQVVLDQYARYTEQATKAVDLLCELEGPARCGELMTAFRRSNPSAGSKLEAVSFTTARELFDNGQDAEALKQFDAYLQDYPQGTNRFAALFFRAQLLERSKRPTDALRDYAMVHGSSQSADFRGPAALYAARLLLAQGKATEAEPLLSLAETACTSVFDRMAASFERALLLQSQKRGTEAEPIFRRLIGETSTTDFTRTRCRLQLGLLFLERDRPDSASVHLRKTVETSRNQFGAQAQHLLNELAWKAKKNEEVKKGVLFIKDTYPAYGHWVARSFLLLVEVYLAEGKRLNANETLKSLIANAPDDDIRQLATRRQAEVQALIDAANAPSPQPEGEADGKPRRRSIEEDGFPEPEPEPQPDR